MQMCNGPSDLLLTRHLRIVRKAILYRSTKDGVRIDQSIALGHNLSIDTARFMVATGAMILSSLSHHLNLLRSEPLQQTSILTNYSPRLQVVRLPIHHQTGIVIGGNGIYHVLFYIVMLSQRKTLSDNRIRMVTLVRRIKSLISR